MSRYTLDRVEQFADQVAQWMDEAGWLQADLARASGLSPNVISTLIRSKERRQSGIDVHVPTRSTVHKILTALSARLNRNVSRKGFSILNGFDESRRRTRREATTPCRAAVPSEEIAADDMVLLDHINRLPRDLRTSVFCLLDEFHKALETAQPPLGIGR
jgi:transcriptional regulator with XRE-family HTH domain